MMCIATFRSLSAAVVLAALLAIPAYGQNQELPLGSTMPMQDEPLQSVTGDMVALAELGGPAGTVVIFWSNQCPWVDKYEQRVFELADEFGSRGLGFVFVNSNDPDAFPKESLSAMEERGYDVPYLSDREGELAAAFGAERAPQVFVFDASDALAYAGAIDDSPGDPGNVQQRYLRTALDELSTGTAVSSAETPPFGCIIKVKR